LELDGQKKLEAQLRKTSKQQPAFNQEDEYYDDEEQKDEYLN
jgi:hypothetical protein